MLLNYAAANRDPDQSEQPNDFVADRKRNRHLAFGFGEHVCVGQHLARLELRVAVTRLLERLPDIELDGPVVKSGIVGSGLMTTVSLPVRFSPER
ncbi:MAG: cytochrome P450 [Rhodococcus sp. (in: high G+C Gram-positive bacteria)]|uniref:cytochrome P450 n=1 Tax=Rhodococcus sp. TaxID=1831 RepID=UPI002AD733ED|nr:cytochrome P450 [Rhodococcus sp. (in: high G+C Gram-positive bacteria)]